jgi:hypothetical protein
MRKWLILRHVLHMGLLGGPVKSFENYFGQSKYKMKFILDDCVQ